MDAYSYLNQSTRPIVLVTIGKGGVGKSNLVNNLLGLEGINAVSVRTATTKPTLYEAQVNGVTLRIVDTPGMEAIDSTERKEQANIAAISEITNGKADLLLYCVSLSGGRFGNADKNITKRLTKAFSDKIWERTILVLTHADVIDSAESESGVENANTPLGRRAIEDYCAEFKAILKDAGVPLSTVSTVQSVTGYDSNVIVAMPAGRKIQQPRQWCDNLRMEILRRCSPDSQPGINMQIKTSNPVSSKAIISTVIGGLIGIIFAQVIGGPSYIVFGALLGAFAPVFGVKLLALLVYLIGKE